MGGQPGFFDVEDRLKRLSDLGDQLEAFAAAVDFELFRPALAAALAYADGQKGGRPPLDPVMMFKALVIQAANNLSDVRHKDRDARWTVKFTKAKPAADGTTPATDLAIPVFGYQNHVSIDRGFGFIRTWAAT